MSFAPPTCRMPLGQASGFPRADPGGRVSPRFWHRLIRFRHFIDGSLALASLNRACRDLVPAFPQRSPPSLLTTAACGGLRPGPDCRPRRVLLHLSYSCAAPCGPAMLVTHDTTAAISGDRDTPAAAAYPPSPAPPPLSSVEAPPAANHVSPVERNESADPVQNAEPTRPRPHYRHAKSNRGRSVERHLWPERSNS